MATAATVPSESIEAERISTDDVIAVVNNARDDGLLAEVLDELDRQRLHRSQLEQEIERLKSDRAKERLRRVKAELHSADAKERRRGHHGHPSLKPRSANETDSVQMTETPKEETKDKKEQKGNAVNPRSRSHSPAAAVPTGASALSDRDRIRLETERDGFRELIDALTADNDAIATALRSPEDTLPLHIVRLLEIIPWDTRTKQYAKATEEVRNHCMHGLAPQQHPTHQTVSAIGYP